MCCAFVDVAKMYSQYGIYEEICKPSARFIAACIRSDSLIKAVVNHSILACCHTVLDSNVTFLARHYGWSVDFVAG